MANDIISRKAAIDAINELHDKPNAWLDLAVDALENLPSAEPEVLAHGEGELSALPEDYTELKREFLRMASYIDVLLECSDEQKETLIGFISRLAEFMPWTERD